MKKKLVLLKINFIFNADNEFDSKITLIELLHSFMQNGISNSQIYFSQIYKQILEALDFLHSKQLKELKQPSLVRLISKIAGIKY